MNVSESMTRNPITCTPDVNIYGALDIMKKEEIHRLPVLDNGILAGIVSEKDIMKASLPDSKGISIHEMAYRISKLSVKDIMSTELVTVTPDTSVEEATRIMVDNEVSCLPVVDNGRLLGIITKTDMYRLLLDLFGARHYGVSAYFLVKDKPGVIAQITSELAKKNADIVSIGTHKSGAPEGTISMKVQGITPKELSDILSPIVVRILDIREA